MEQCPTSEADRFSASQEILRNLWNSRFITFLQNPPTCHTTEPCCMTAVRNGGIFRYPVMRTKPDINIHDMESQVVINISEYRAAAMYSETVVRVFQELLKQLTKIQCVIT